MPARTDRIRQLIDTVIDRRAAGESINDEELIAQHPELMPELAEELDHLRHIEQAQNQVDMVTVERGLHLRCPHCQNPVEVVEEASLSDVVCPSCGSHFSLVEGPQSFQATELESIGHFKILDRLGAGAFGSVWSARDTELDRTVAVKFPRKGQLSPQDTEQFLREARAAAQLNHPHIVRVHEVGREGDRVYIVTDFVQGLDLADWLTDQQATPREAADLCATVADALQHAHEHGVIHRDLKPSNIMLDSVGEPHLMDFGLAKREAGEMTMTVEGKLLGTPAYMSPEQARGDAHDADARSDVYSLGVILFELLTGERPFRGSTRMLLHQVLVEDAPSPRNLNSTVPRDLETICLKCLEKDANHRYQTVRELSDDLQRFISGQPVLWRPITKPARAWRWCKRNPLISSLVASLILVVLVGLMGVTSQWIRAQTLWVRAEENAANEAEAKRAYQRLLYFSDMDTAREAWERNEVIPARHLLRRHTPAAGEEDLRGVEWFYLWRQYMGSIARTTLRHGGLVRHVRFSKTGNRLISTSAHGVVHWSLPAKQRVVDWPMEPYTISGYAVMLSPDGKSVAYGHLDGVVTIAEIETAERYTLQGHDSRVFALAFSPDGKTLASGDSNGTLCLWDVEGRKQRIAPISAHDETILCTVFSPDGNILATGGKDQSAKTWDVATGYLKSRLDVSKFCSQSSAVYSVSFSPDGETMATGCDGDNFVMLWDADSGDHRGNLVGHAGYVAALAFSPDGKTLASGSGDRRIKLWNVQSGQPRETFKGQPSAVWSLAYSADGSCLASGDYHGTIKLWDVRTNPTRNLLVGHKANVWCVAFSPDDQTLASGDWSGNVILWDLATESVISQLQHEKDKIVDAVTFSPDGKILATASWNKTVKLWDVTNGKLLSELPHKAIVHCVAFSKDGKVLASGGEDTNITLWDVQSGKLVKTLAGHRFWVYSLVFTPDGTTLASSCATYGGTTVLDHTVRLWDFPSGQLKKVLDQHAEYKGIPSATFSADGKMFVTAGADGKMKVWDVRDWSLIRTIETTESDHQSVRFMPDGRTLIQSSGEWVPMRFWDIETGELRFTIPHRVHCVAVSRSGTIIATGSSDAAVRLWRVATRKEVEAARW